MMGLSHLRGGEEKKMRDAMEGVMERAAGTVCNCPSYI